ncbi:MAG: hypothetical protein IT338_17970 [Thermomicrobiales bacterium]|nr:hypothetical protein [Thermomicrobiales bacterium]
MADLMPGAIVAAFSQRVARRNALRALAALLLGGAVTERLAAPGLARHRHHDRPRKRLRRRCRRQCRRVHNDCLRNCHDLGMPDDICHPRCSIAKRSCRRGCR